ncbi:hypothetical protein MPNT_290017 [Candidatus Methylacidithermus pantelleriae]|uniref:Uncharacterized protein n=1 Tax=Candidatus Methylacidithermus pantelleriae TaxID=2744239 RepID=A0A8J2FSG9_9BACT|nr:hypothetical protein MPNT_290017 [Candidatus Methylacidithermus pantelleriae]
MFPANAKGWFLRPRTMGVFLPLRHRIEKETGQGQTLQKESLLAPLGLFLPKDGIYLQPPFVTKG